MKNIFLPFILLLTFVFSCRENGNEEIEKNVAAVNLYIAGVEDNQACYWKNGQKILLQNGTGLYATQIIAENNNVYVFGSMISEYGSTNTAKHYYLWINNVRYNLDEYLEDVPDPVPGNDFYIYSKMIVKNGNIYFSGSVTLPNIGSTGYTTTMYNWKNGVKNIIMTSNNNITLGSFALFNDVLYAGTQKNTQNTLPVNWERGFLKNNIYSLLPPNNTILDFYQENTEIHALIKNLLTNETNIKNLDTNTISQLPSNAPSDIKQVIIDGNDKYYVGNNFYYKNNNLIYFNDLNGYNTIGLFVVKDQNIYTIRYNENTGTGTSGNDLAKVFINSTEVLSKPITSVFATNLGGLLSLSVE